jgi:hypothetical protein
VTKEPQDAGVISRVLLQFPARPAVSDAQMLENVRSALGRKLPIIRKCKRHDRVMSIAGGGPSLQDTYKDLTGVIVTANAGLSYLLSKNIVPWACGLLDAREHIADMIEPRKDVFFFVASTCSPKVFDKLKDCTVILWHPSGMPGISEELPEGTDMIGGGSTMGLRWINIGYVMGFRRFECHGFDSSYRGTRTHAYDDYRDGKEPSLVVGGFSTAINFLEQIEDFKKVRGMFGDLEDRPEILLHGDGLLQRTCSM